ncbi:hypothetical protein L0Y65_01455 [Candidatus Micrarchaeota archaeon]|nr:hypothetical protein [Candidatus Micrarchaeota archaeon]
MRLLFTAILALLVISAGCAQQAPAGNNTTACTEEAKICPDGSAVGRIGPDCEFAPCPQIVGNDSDAHGCKPSAGYSWCEAKQKCLRPFEEACEGGLTESDVRQIAQAACGATGNLSDEMTYNPNSKTYWIGLDAVKPGCSPACVVSELDRTAEINWRCTGAIPPYTVKTANSSLGEILVNGDGFTLYTFSDDSANKTTCYGACAVNWPPLLISDTIAVPKGLPGTFGAILRNDSSLQVTYNGMPLYAYASDMAAGDTNGQGAGGKWYVVEPTD